MTTATKKFIEAVGRRKTSVARVRLSEAAKNSFTINDKSLVDYFPVLAWSKKIERVLEVAKPAKHYNISVKVSGGGISSQAVAVCHGLARALTKSDTDTKAEVKKAGLLTRDSRMKERRKFGLKKARKSPQWSKR